MNAKKTRLDQVSSSVYTLASSFVKEPSQNVLNPSFSKGIDYLNHKFKTLAQNLDTNLNGLSITNELSTNRKIKRRNKQPRHAYMSIAPKEFKNQQAIITLQDANEDSA